MKDLPLELVGAVAGEVVSTTDLLSLRTVNKVLHTFLTPRAFRRLRVRCDESFIQKARGMAKLEESEELAKLVEEVVLDDQVDLDFTLEWPKDEDDFALQQRRELSDALARTFSHLYRFPSLKTVHLNFWPTLQKRLATHAVHEHPMGFLARQCAIVYAILSQQDGAPLLSSLTLTNLALLHFQGYSNMSTASLSSLTHLSLSVLSNDEHAKLVRLPQTTILPFIVSPSTLFPPTQSSALRSLTLKSDRGPFYLPDMRLSGLHYPNLDSLSLENFVFHHSLPEDGLEGFILRHKISLRRLEMRSCSMFIGVSSEYIRFWSDVWDAFSAELDSVVEFIIGEDDDSNLGYTTSNPVVSYVAYLSINDLRVGHDKSALARFRTVVEANKTAI